MNWFVDYKFHIFLQELVTIDGRIAGNDRCYKQKKKLELNCILATRGTTGVSLTSIILSCKFSVNVGKPVCLSLSDAAVAAIFVRRL